MPNPFSRQAKSADKLHWAWAFACALLLGSVASPCSAVALRPQRATDNSVCDLGHQTTAFLGSMMLIPAEASSKDQVDAYFRLAAQFIATKCKNGQWLILHGASSSGIDTSSLGPVANSACLAAQVSRTEAAFARAGRSEPGFELRCPISKHEELVQQLAELEKTDPLETLKARLSAAGQEEKGKPGPAGSQKKDCSKLSLASLLGGGKCK